jgi:hypothetical protein
VGKRRLLLLQHLFNISLLPAAAVVELINLAAVVVEVF